MIPFPYLPQIIALPVAAGGGGTVADIFIANSYRGGHWPVLAGGIWKDTARTIAATTAADLVAALDDVSGNANHFLQATSGARPILRFDGAGNAKLEFASGRFMTAGNGSALAPRTDCAFLSCANRIGTTAAFNPLLNRAVAAGIAGRLGLYRSLTSAVTVYDDGDVTDGVEAFFASTETTTIVHSSNVKRYGVGVAGEFLVRKAGTNGTATPLRTNDKSFDHNSAWRLLLGGYGNSGDSGQAGTLVGDIYGATLLYSSAPIDSAYITTIEAELAALYA
jgi:hypothetical protein